MIRVRRPSALSRHAVLAILGVVFTAMAPSEHLASQSQPDAGLFVRVPPATRVGQRDRLPDPTSIRSRIVTIDFDLLRAAGPGEPPRDRSAALRLNLFDDTLFEAEADRVEWAPGRTSWVGRISGVPQSTVVLETQDGVMAGSIVMPGAVYAIRYVGGDLHAINQVDQSRYRQELPPIEVVAGKAAPTTVNAEPGGDDGSTIDLLVLYTSAAAVHVGGTAAMNARINLGVSESNTSYASSGITQRLRLVYAGGVAYTENDDLALDLYNVSNYNGSVISTALGNTAASLRNTYGADLVMLITDPAAATGCGISWIMTFVSSGFAPYGFSVVEESCISPNYTFAHELGHNMGARHDWYVDPAITPYSYSHGYIKTSALWRTVMAYNDLCFAKVGQSCTRLLYWSNPGVSYGGVPMGIAGGTSTACTQGNVNNPDCDADDHRTLNATALIVANFRQALAQPNWTQKSPANSPSPRSSHAMAYDAARGQVVLFGGFDGNPLNDTWVWDGTTWTRKSPANSPSLRYHHAMAYDAARGQVVLFGGYDAGLDVELNDTWVWDGTNWTQKSPANSPSPRSSHAMAYDAARGQVVLFGGWGRYGPLNDTWVWDGTTWTQKSPANSPPSRDVHAMAYDAARGQVVLFGGHDGNQPGRLNDTWVWDGTTWTRKSPASSPSSRFGHAMAYDAARGQVVLFGGWDNNSLNDTWVWPIAVTAPEPPANDDFNNAVLVNTSPFTATANTVGATIALDDPVIPCVASQKWASVWYRYTPSVAGVLDVDTYTSTYDTVLAVWTGSRGSLTAVACNDDTGGLQSHVNLAVTAGQVYYIEVASYGPGGGILNLHAFGALVAAGDYNGDGKSDVLWRHETRGEVWLWAMNGAARTSETHVRTVADTNWEIRGDGDQTGDGKADILWRNRTTGQIYLWPMDGTTVLSETYVATVDPAYDIVGTGDYNGDGKSDILWRHLTTGAVWIWLMNGATPLSQVNVDTVDPGYAVVGSGDLNGDAKADIVFHHGTLGQVWVWLMNGTTRTSQTHIGTVGDVGYKIVGVADHTGDGKADILWHHATRGEVWIWPMDGTAVVSESYVDTVPDTGYQIVGTGDYNGDSKADILWHHATRGEMWVWLMNGTTRISQTWVATVPVDVGFDSQFNGSSAGWVGHTGAWFIDAGSWLSAAGIANSWTSASNTGVFSDFNYEVRLWRTGSDNSTSLWVRGTPDPLTSNAEWNNGYLFNYTRTGTYAVWKVVAGVEVFLAHWAPTSAIIQGDAWNTLRVVANGTSLSLYINGILVWSGADGTFASGRAGVASYTDASTGSQVWVDYAVLTRGSYVVVDTLSAEQQRLNEAAQREGGNLSMGQSKK